MDPRPKNKEDSEQEGYLSRLYRYLADFLKKNKRGIYGATLAAMLFLLFKR